MAAKIDKHPLASSEHESEPGKISRFLASSFFSADYEADTGTASYPTYFGGVHLGAVDVFRHEGSGIHRGYRRLHHFRTDRVDDFLISLPLRGRTRLTQMGSEVQVEADEFIISSTAKPLGAISRSDNNNTFQTYHVRVSGPLLRAQVPAIDSYCHQQIKIGSGAGTIMSSMFALAIHEGSALSASQSRSFGGMLVEAIANTTRDAPELMRLHPGSRQSSYARVREDAGHFIACNLSNPALDPLLIAAHCRVSVRYLHAAFAAASQTLGTHIRETRLEQCRAALQSPELRDRSVFEIALRWGFNDPAYFSRAYKSRFGSSPRDDRRLK